MLARDRLRELQQAKHNAALAHLAQSIQANRYKELDKYAQSSDGKSFLSGAPEHQVVKEVIIPLCDRLDSCKTRPDYLNAVKSILKIVEGRVCSRATNLFISLFLQKFALLLYAQGEDPKQVEETLGYAKQARGYLLKLRSKPFDDDDLFALYSNTVLISRCLERLEKDAENFVFLTETFKGFPYKGYTTPVIEAYIELFKAYYPMIKAADEGKRYQAEIEAHLKKLPEAVIKGNYSLHFNLMFVFDALNEIERCGLHAKQFLALVPAGLSSNSLLFPYFYLGKYAYYSRDYAAAFEYMAKSINLAPVWLQKHCLKTLILMAITAADARLKGAVLHFVGQHSELIEYTHLKLLSWLEEEADPGKKEFLTSIIFQGFTLNIREPNETKDAFAEDAGQAQPLPTQIPLDMQAKPLLAQVSGDRTAVIKEAAQALEKAKDSVAPAEACLSTLTQEKANVKLVKAFAKPIEGLGKPPRNKSSAYQTTAKAVAGMRFSQMYGLFIKREKSKIACGVDHQAASIKALQAQQPEAFAKLAARVEEGKICRSGSGQQGLKFLPEPVRIGDKKYTWEAKVLGQEGDHRLIGYQLKFPNGETKVIFDYATDHKGLEILQKGRVKGMKP